MKRTSFWLVGIVICFIASSAVAKEVVIVTSFPKELFETYKKTFESKNPGITVIINSKQTNAGVTYLRETKAKPVPYDGHHIQVYVANFSGPHRRLLKILTPPTTRLH